MFSGGTETKMLNALGGVTAWVSGQLITMVVDTMVPRIRDGAEITNAIELTLIDSQHVGRENDVITTATMNYVIDYPIEGDGYLTTYKAHAQT